MFSYSRTTFPKLVLIRNVQSPLKRQDSTRHNSPSAIPALWRLRQEDCSEFEASLGYIVKTKPSQRLHETLSHKMGRVEGEGRREEGRVMKTAGAGEELNLSIIHMASEAPRGLGGQTLRRLASNYMPTALRPWFHVYLQVRERGVNWKGPRHVAVETKKHQHQLSAKGAGKNNVSLSRS